MRLNPRQGLRGNVQPTGSPEKGRYQQADQRRLYPLSTFNSWTARPFSYALWKLGFTPNQVSLLSLLVSVVGLLRAADGVWSHMVQGALLVHLGLVLDHADGQVARRSGKGSTFGMFLDMVIDRAVEIGLVLTLALAQWMGVRAVPDLLPAPWEPLGTPWFLVACIATVGAMMLWRFLGAYTDILYLRSFLLAQKRLPQPDLRPASLAKRPLVPWVFNRDWVLAIWAVGLVLGQVQGTLLLLLALHLLSCLEKVVVFTVRHRQPEADASRILAKDYH